MKYITCIDSLPAIHMFSDHETHAEVARKLGGEVVGAGFVRLFDERGNYAPECFGESVLLGVKSRPEDTLYLRAALNYQREDAA